MARTIFAVSAFLLVIARIGHADDRWLFFPDLGFKQQQLSSLDRQASQREYEEMYRGNQEYTLNTLKSYSKHALVYIGLPEKAVDVMGATLGLVTKGAKLDLNESRTLAVELKNVGSRERVLYFGLNLDW